MGQAPKGVTVAEAEERIRKRDRVKGAANYIVASLIEHYLKYDAGTLQIEYGLTALEAAQVIAKLKAMQVKIDPDGDWQ